LDPNFNLYNIEVTDTDKCIVGSFVGWNIVVQLISSRTFTVAPYNWPIGDLRLLSISGFIGAALAIFFGGKLINLISSYMTKRAGGRREPKYRLSPWIQPAVGYAMQGFELAAVSNVIVTYAVDSYLPVSTYLPFFPFLTTDII
jgi:hypothetical protein